MGSSSKVDIFSGLATVFTESEVKQNVRKNEISEIRFRRGWS